MWMSEALWAARISPFIRVADLDDETLARVLDEAHALMAAALSGPRAPRRAYRRAGRPCRRCGTPIRSHGLGEANRTAYWCPSCQPALEREPAQSALRKSVTSSTKHQDQSSPGSADRASAWPTSR